MRCRITARKRIAACGLSRYRFQSVGYGQLFPCPRLGRTQKLFDFAPPLFNRVEVGTVGGQEASRRATVLNKGKACLVFVRGKVVDNDDVVRAQGGTENLADIFAENILRGCPLDRHTGLGTIKTKGRNQGRRIPVTVRSVIDNPLPGAASSSQARHVCFRP